MCQHDIRYVNNNLSERNLSYPNDIVGVYRCICQRIALASAPNTLFTVTTRICVSCSMFQIAVS